MKVWRSSRECVHIMKMSSMKRATICMVEMEHVVMRPSQIWRETNWRKKEPFWFP